MISRIFVKAELNAQNRVGFRPRYLPIVFVPGFLGTRLADPETGALVWNPLGGPHGDDGGFFAADADRLADDSVELVPDESKKYKWKSDRDAVKDITGVYTVLSQRYKPLLLRLANPATYNEEGQRRRIKPRVYVCGYDWRVDIGRSAARLSAMVDRALYETGAPRVILVCHCLGAMVARYYSRVLAGESKVHRMVTIGDMIHGVPEAFTQLKAGVSGLYVDELIDAAEGNMSGADAASRAATAAAPLAAAIGAAVAAAATGSGGGTGFLGFMAGLVGDLYLALVLGSRRLITRPELRTLVRRMPSTYQMLPTAIYCKAHPTWVMFNPLATGVAPAGFTVRLPFTIGAITDLAVSHEEQVNGGSRRAGEEVRRGISAFLGGEPATSKRATVNAPTVVELFEQASRAAAEGRSEAPTDACRDLVERLEQTFLDARNPTRLYQDIYTGLFNRVEDRALCAANLAIGLRTHRALIEHYEEAEPITAMSLFQPVLTLLSSGIFGAIDLVFHGGQRSRAEWRAGAQEEAAERARRERDHPRAYVHPRTITVYSETQPTVSGTYLWATEVLAKHDHNVVRWEMSADVVASVMQLVAAGGASGIASGMGALGDGHVPTVSSYPAADTLTAPFLLHHAVPHVAHGNLCTSANVLDYLKEQLDASLVEFAALR